MSTCDVCGSHQMHPAVVDGIEMERCGLCDHLQGDAEMAERLEQRERAQGRGFHHLVFELVEALEQVPTFDIVQASAGNLETLEYPCVFIRVQEGGLQDLEHLLTSLEMTNRVTARRWVIECLLAARLGLVHLLRPRFWKAVQEIHADDIREARTDLPLLARAIARDVDLGWWRG